MNVLIATDVGDQHAVAVAVALQIKGHSPTLWFGADCPRTQTQSVSIGLGNEPRLIVQDSFGMHWNSNDIDACWMRRNAPPMLQGLAKSADIPWLGATWNLFQSGFIQCFPVDTFWVNCPLRQRDAEAKVTQLAIAKSCGFNIPETLVSNDPDLIRDFVIQRTGQVIFKPLIMLQRHMDGRQFIARAMPVSVSQVLNEAAVRAGPNIFQQRIDVQMELRTTVMGDRVITASIGSNSGQEYLDWRTIRRGDRRIEPFELPEPIRSKCVDFVKKMGLAFACLDILFSSDGEYFFLEANPSGQFLWLENENPKIELLDAFCNFITVQNAACKAQDHRQVTLQEVMNTHALKELTARSGADHVVSNTLNVLHE